MLKSGSVLVWIYFFINHLNNKPASLRAERGNPRLCSSNLQSRSVNWGLPRHYAPRNDVKF